MRVVTLAPLTPTAKRIIKAHGERWEVIRKGDLSAWNGPGPWLLVQPLTEERAPSATVRQARVETAMCWINEFNDEVFYISVNEEKQRVINTQPAHQFVAKDRSGKLDAAEQPDLMNIIRKIQANKPASNQGN